MDNTTEKLLENAKKTYLSNFPPETWFGRCIFLSWYCDLGTCKFCFRSTTKHRIKFAENAKRSVASILTDALIGKNLGWTIEFLTGGYRIFSFEEMLAIAKHVSEIYGEKIWINLGTMEDEKLKQLKPYVEGVCASIETVNPKLHAEICPYKPIEPYEDFLDRAEKLGFKKSITIVIGLGETKEDFEMLAEFITRHKLDRITFYALKPVKGTGYENSPDPEYYAWWIAQTRVRFPKLHIMAGLTPKNVEYASLILRAGANAITKFPAVKRFGSAQARRIEELAAGEGREFRGSLTSMPQIDAAGWDKQVEKLGLAPALEKAVKEKLRQSVEGMKTGKIGKMAGLEDAEEM
jgi:biotin synthase-like enzyme